MSYVKRVLASLTLFLFIYKEVYFWYYLFKRKNKGYILITYAFVTQFQTFKYHAYLTKLCVNIPEFNLQLEIEQTLPIYIYWIPV